MARIKPRPQVRGARDLAARWNELPVAVMVFSDRALSSGLGLDVLSNTLRARAWRDHCVSATSLSCADAGHSCSHPGRCRADMLFPMQVGGGAPSWRMATLFVHWRPSKRQLWLIALGEPACDALGWAIRVLERRHGLAGGEKLAVSRFGDLELTGGARWELTFVTPWLVGKNRLESNAPLELSMVAHELRKALRIRAYKLTALCMSETHAQRLTAHLAHHVSEALLPEGLTVEWAELEPHPLELASRSNHASFVAHTWNGRAILQVAPEVLPWLSLIALCGGGENADKGFGSVELTSLN
jgi:hypothetical protein